MRIFPLFLMLLCIKAFAVPQPEILYCTTDYAIAYDKDNSDNLSPAQHNVLHSNSTVVLNLTYLTITEYVDGILVVNNTLRRVTPDIYAVNGTTSVYDFVRVEGEISASFIRTDTMKYGVLIRSGTCTENKKY